MHASHTRERPCVCVWNEPFPETLNTLRGMSVVLTGSSLTDSQERFHSQLFFFFFWSHDTHLQQHFWFIGLISLRWWSTKDVKQNLQRVFYGVFHRYVCLVEDLLSHAHADGETCTCGYREDTYHSLRLEVFHDFHRHRIICPRFPCDKCKNISAWFNEYHKIMCCPKLRSIWFHVLGNSQTHCKLVRKADFKGELWSFEKKFKLRILRRL